MSFICDSCGTDDCDNCSEQKDFAITILNYWDDPYLTRVIRAKTAGAAKYNYWLRFGDAYGDMRFGEFIKITKIRKLA